MDPARGLLMAALLVSARPSELKRRADWGFRMEAQAGGARVTGVRGGSAAERAGLRDGDRVVSIDDEDVADAGAIEAARRRHRGGDRIRLRIRREAETLTLSWTLPTLPTERIPGCDVAYGSVETSFGDRVRTVVTRPSGARGRVPAIVFVPWLSCDPVEGDVPGDGWMQLLRGLAARSGWAVVRVEKPGVGDSEGPDCGSNDLERDLAAFRAALDRVPRLPGVDGDRIVLFGASIGGALAPVLARECRATGLIVSGGFSRTWLEHMLDFERRRLTREGATPGEVHRSMRGYADFYALYLNQGLTPAEVLSRRPDLAPLWHDAPNGQYGRPAAYYRQVQDVNVEQAWAEVDVPVLVLQGEYDAIMSLAEGEHVVEIVNARGEGRASLAVLPRTDHNLSAFPTRAEADRGENGRFDPELVDRVIAWLRRLPDAGR
jgi:pimeloyl-ACP methyl ester carboxylesterase